MKAPSKPEQMVCWIWTIWLSRAPSSPVPCRIARSYQVLNANITLGFPNELQSLPPHVLRVVCVSTDAAIGCVFESRGSELRHSVSYACRLYCACDTHANCITELLVSWHGEKRIGDTFPFNTTLSLALSLPPLSVNPYHPPNPHYVSLALFFFITIYLFCNAFFCLCNHFKY